MSLSTGINNWEVALHNWNPSGRKKFSSILGPAEWLVFPEKEEHPFLVYISTLWPYPKEMTLFQLAWILEWDLNFHTFPLLVSLYVCTQARLNVLASPLLQWAWTTDTQWRHKSKKSENLGLWVRQNMLRLHLKIWDWDWIFGRAVKAISCLGVHSPWWGQWA